MSFYFNTEVIYKLTAMLVLFSIRTVPKHPPHSFMIYFSVRNKRQISYTQLPVNHVYKTDYLKF